MPSLDLYKKMHDESYNGRARKSESDMIFDSTFTESIGYQVGYFYDYYHDEHITQLNDLHPEKDSKKIPIELHFNESTQQTLDKDVVSKHIRFKSNQECVVDYYDEFFVKRYGAEFPLGLYCDIADNKGHYNRWLVVAKANDNNEYTTYEVLRCDYIYQYIINKVKYQIAGVSRSQNSYNSGIWNDLRVTSPEDQAKCILPLNRDTEKIFYGLRFIIDAPVLSEPRAWQTSKPWRMIPNGLIRLTFAQVQFNSDTDLIEEDDNGNVIGMWADGKNTSTTDYSPITSDIYSKITASGSRSELKVGGSYKTFTVNFYKNDEPMDFLTGSWIYTIDGKDASSLLLESTPVSLKPNQVKIKFVDNDEYIGKVLSVMYLSDDGISSELKVDIVAL